MEGRFAQLHGTGHCVSFCSGFMALMIAIRVCALPDKTEVVMPSLTYRRMADIVAWTGLVPHFCDVDEVSLGMTAKTAAKAVNENTALILGVHPITNLCDIDGIEALSQEYSIPLVFDAVEAAYAEHNGKMVGGFGKAEGFSFHASKLLNGFEGGYVTTDDASLAEELRCVRNFGFAGKDNIVWLGLNAKLNELHAAMAMACIDILPEHISQNRARHYAWQEAIAELPSLALLLYSDTELRGYKNALVRCEDTWPLSRDNTLRILHAENMLARPFYNPPLHKSPGGFLTVCNSDMSVTEEVTKKYMLLPSGEFVSVEDISVMGKVLSFLQQHAEEINNHIEEKNL
jgi:dTDP-4-amino-4,6-dideoxygalactose transaminase